MTCVNYAVSLSGNLTQLIISRRFGDLRRRCDLHVLSSGVAGLAGSSGENGGGCGIFAGFAPPPVPAVGVLVATVSVVGGLSWRKCGRRPPTVPNLRYY